MQMTKVQSLVRELLIRSHMLHSQKNKKGQALVLSHISEYLCHNDSVGFELQLVFTFSKPHTAARGWEYNVR